MGIRLFCNHWVMTMEFITARPELIHLFSICCVLAGAGLCLVSWKSKKSINQLARSKVSLCFTLFSFPSPIITLAITFWVFYVKGASPIAQCNNDTGHQVWRLWAGSWMFLLLGNCFSIVLNLISVCLFFKPIKYPMYFASRLLISLAAIAAFYATFILFPDC